MCEEVREIDILQSELPVAAKSEDELLKEFRKCTAVRKKELYFQILFQIKMSIIRGEISQLMKMNAVLVCMKKEVSALNYLAYSCSPDNPLRNVNIIILICKYGHFEVLEFIFSENCKILQNWPINLFENGILSTDTDEYQHNAFYYAIRSGKANVVQILLKKWPNGYPFQNSGNLYEVLSDAYRELKLKNVELPIEMEVLIREVLFEEDFYNKDETQNSDGQLKENVEKRIGLVLNKIEILTNEFSELQVDEKFLAVAKFIAKNIYILKGQLQFTYDTIPWEEIEFCLVIFINSVTESKENNLFHARSLSKNRILMHLKNFANCLSNAQNLISQKNEIALQKLPTLNDLIEIVKESGCNLQLREGCISRIVKENSFFKELYKDYDKVRDEYSLKTMQRYLDLAISVKYDAKGLIIISRTLQVVGEHIKNTLKSPKLSDITCKFLLSSLPKNTRDILIDLRNSLSHSESMSKRIEIEKGNEEFFSNIQDDLKKLNLAIAEVLCQSKIRVIREKLKKISECAKAEELKEILKSLHFENAGEELSEIPVVSQLKKMEILVKDLSCNIKEKTQQEKELFDKINHKIVLVNNRLNKIKMKMITGLNSYNRFVYKSQQSKFEDVKNKAKRLLDETSIEMEYSRLNEIFVLSETIWKCVTPKLAGKELDNIRYMHWQLQYSIAFEIGKIKLIEEYKCNINKKQNKTETNLNTSYQTELIDNLLSQKLSQLKNVLDNDNFRYFPLLEIDKKSQVVLEMLILDIYSVLEKNMSYNHLFLDDEPVTLIGRNMRNHLAHDNSLNNVISTDTLIDLVLNGKKIAIEGTLNNRKQIGKVFKCDINKLQFEHEKDLGIVALQKRMFMALANGNFEIVKNTLQKGAVIKGKCMRSKTALHFASEGTNIETVQLALNAKCDIDARDENGRSALHIAAFHGRSNIVEYLIKAKNVLIDQLDRFKKSPLHIAAEQGHLEVVNILLNFKASSKVQDVHGNSPLHYSINNNHEGIVKALLELEGDVDKDEAFGGLTPLYVASSKGYLKLVNYLIRKKANVNAETDTLCVPLHAAVLGGHLEIVEALIEKGAKVTSRCMDGTSALHMVSTTGQESILQLLLEHETNVDDVMNILRRSPMTYAAENGNLGIVKLLLKNKEAKVNTKDVNGKTPLHFAAENGHVRVVKILIENEASLDAADHIGFTAMHYAACNGHTSVVRLLIKHGGCVHSTEVFRATPLNLAVLNGHLNVMKVLIDEKAYVNNSDISNSTALHICCENQSLEMAELLIKSEADIHVPSLLFGITPFHLALGLGSKAMLEVFKVGGANVEDIKTTDFTALHLATVNGDLEVIQYLIDLKCDVNAKSKSGLTALHLAVEQNNMGAIDLLVKNGPILNVFDNNGYTPLHYAVRSKNKRIINYLIEKGANVGDEGYGEPLTSAVVYGFHELVTILLKNGKFDVNVRLANNDSLLITSVLYRHKKIADILLENGADINTKSNDTTPLFAATLLGDFEMVKLLLTKKANPNFTSRMEEVTPLYAAITEGHIDIVDILLNAGARNVDSTNRSALQLAVQSNRVEVVKCLLEKKSVDVHEKTVGQLSLLHIAASMNNLEIVKCLVNKGADINTRDIHGRNPIIVAAERGHKDIVEFLHNISDKDANLHTFLLLLAIKNGHLEVTNFLIENCVDAISTANCTANILHIAAKFNRKDILLYFLDNGACYYAYNQNKKTPFQMTNCPDIKRVLNLVRRLFIAIKCNALLSLEEVIKGGAIINVKRKDNATPLHYAAWKGYSGILNSLLKNGANPNIFGSGKGTPLHFAAKYGHFNIVRSLLSHGAIYNVQSFTGKTPLDYSQKQDITELLSLVDNCFKSIQSGDLEFLEDLKALKDIETIKSVMKSRNEEKKLLVTFAMCHNFSNIKQLKEILKVDMNSMYAEATEHGICGRYSEALKLFNEILESKTEILECDNPGILEIKDKIGEVLLNQNDLDRALKVFKENFEAKKESFGADNISTLQTKAKLAVTRYKLGEKEEALKLLQEVYNQQTIGLGEKHSDVIETQFVMATMLEQEGKDDEAMAKFSTICGLLEGSNGENHLKCLKIQIEMAIILIKQKKYNEALGKLQHLYDAETGILGPKHSSTLRSLGEIAHVYHIKGNCNEALKLYENILHLQKTEYGADNLQFFAILISIGNVLLAQQKMLTAFKIFIKCYYKGLEMVGPNHVLTQTAQKSMQVVKFPFSLQHGEVGRCILEQLEKDMGYAATGRRRCPEESVHEASELYSKLVKRNKYYPLTKFISDEWARYSGEVTRDNFMDFVKDLSIFRAMCVADDREETEPWKKFPDKDVFHYMRTLKNIHSGVHMKFSDISST